jgi:hypothetical protein
LEQAQVSKFFDFSFEKPIMNKKVYKSLMEKKRLNPAKGCTSRLTPKRGPHSYGIRRVPQLLPIPIFSCLRIVSKAKPINWDVFGPFSSQKH